VNILTDSISLLDLSDALATPTARRAIEDIAGENYANASILLEQEYSKNNKVYIHQNDAGQPDAFFMVGWSKVDGVEGQTVFLGLSSVSNRVKSRGIGKSLYRAFFDDAAESMRLTGIQVTWWFHTATPAVANAFWNIAQETVPRPDGSFNESNRRIVEIIKRHYGMDSYACSSHPFVLRGYAKARYALDEVQRIEAYFAGANQDHLLKRFAIDERNGDRVLFMGQITSGRVGKP
jgi:hypothetical protein